MHSLPVLENNASNAQAASTCSGSCAGNGAGCCLASGAPSPGTHSEASHREGNVNAALLDAPEHVLSTLDKDGHRRWMSPCLSRGKWWQRRRALAYGLICFFVVAPHLRIFGEPVILLDIVARQFTLLGHTFLPTDTILLALLFLLATVSIVFLTTALGRVWCGWACPQTVYIEFLFRPFDRLFDGTRGKGGKPKRELGLGLKTLRLGLYIAITSVLAHSFLAYFVGTDRLSMWLLGSPLEHPVAFLVMLVTTALLTFDFLYFREQTCMIACPYGRFQSVMLDRQSLIVAYDSQRGEPRAKGKRVSNLQKTFAEPEKGDCLDCNQCVRTCPVGIDIRDGLQMECINCTQCIDACDDVMTRAGMETGLIRYTSQDALDGKEWSFFRVRTVIYPVLLTVLAVCFLAAASTKYSFDARVIRGKGAPFAAIAAQEVSNTFSVRIVNRSDQEQQYSMQLIEPAIAELLVIEPELLELERDGSNLVPIQVRFPPSLTKGLGNADVQLEIRDTEGNQRTLEFVLIGPR